MQKVYIYKQFKICLSILTSVVIQLSIASGSESEGEECRGEEGVARRRKQQVKRRGKLIPFVHFNYYNTHMMVVQQ